MNAGFDLGRACARRRAAIASAVARRCASRNLIRLPMVCPRRLEKSPIVRKDRNPGCRDEAHEDGSMVGACSGKTCPGLDLGRAPAFDLECAKYMRGYSAYC